MPEAASVETLKELGRQLAKAASESRTEDVLAVLKQLKTSVEPTEEIIRATKIGVGVGKLRTHNDSRVSDLAKELVKLWKTQVEKQRRESSQKDKKRPSAAETPAASTASKESAAAPAAAASSDGKVNIDFEVLHDKTRNACLKLLYGSLEIESSFDRTTVYEKALAIEKATFDNIGNGGVNGDYRAKVRSLSLNIKDKNNPELRQQVLRGDIEPNVLIFMRSEELASSALKAERESIQQQNLHNAKGAEAQEAETDAFQCGKCKQRKTRYYQMQTRSADEPMTTDIFALGGSKEDLDLINSNSGETTLNESELSRELQQFLAANKIPGMSLPKEKAKQTTASKKEPTEKSAKDKKGSAEGKAGEGKAKNTKAVDGKSVDSKSTGKPAESKPSANPAESKLSAKSAESRPSGKPAESKPTGKATDSKPPGKTRPESKAQEKGKDTRPNEGKGKHAKEEPRKAREQPAAPSASGKHMRFDGDTVVVSNKGKLLIEPVPEWSSIKLPELEQSTRQPSESSITHLQQLGQRTLDEENSTYAEISNSGGSKYQMLGSMSISDLQFARSLISTNRAGTLSDRISALTLLLQSSPLHNIKTLETLMTMASRPSREESGRATRALADWFASSSGLGESKLHYFRDQPLMAAAAASSDSNAVRMHACIWAYEDLLKRTYFAFVQLLEKQSHDPLVFVRKQAVQQIFILLRDKPEQEHNLLRLLTNKLGDPDRSVAAKASTHLMELLQAHPAMKGIVIREISEAVLASQLQDARRQTGSHNQHMTYYGVLTLNQTLFTAQDAPVANDLFRTYFNLFNVCLKQNEAAEKEPVEEEETRDKKRWRDRGKAAQKNRTATDVDSRLLAALLAGIRRVFPFTTLDTDALDEHLNTLFRITHSHSFNIAVQALQLVFQVAVQIPSSGASARGFSQAVADRFYRTLYDSLLDSRLATTSKQAMYLNLLFKALRDDSDVERVKAFIKRLCQVLTVQEPAFVCGSLYLLHELVKGSPGLRTMITEPEEEDEQFYDIPEDGQVEKRAPRASAYDARKRDPRFAHAGDTALWDILPLVQHFHPSVALNAQQLLAGEVVTSTADLTQHTLMHFLDRFVYRNPKKNVSLKGPSIMQPALGGTAEGDVRVRSHVRRAGEQSVNTAEFWNRAPEKVPVDERFFLRFFQAKKNRSQLPQEKTEAPQEVDSDFESDEEGEQDVWNAIKASMPKGDTEDIDDDDDDDIIAAMGEEVGVDSDDDDADDGAEDDAEDDIEDDDDDDDDDDDEDDDSGDVDAAGIEDYSSDGEDATAMFEDEDDLIPSDEEVPEFDDSGIPFTDFDAAAGTKRPADDAPEPQGKNKERALRRKKLRAMPAFASAEEYAHMLPSDDEGDV
ncbi:RNA-binding ribosome biosynthesis protein mak21 [Malassezia cuniculi]|uniref:RNA-binding ribosome biosynthesis protein mak21 n=1 Tax=Malassezia cuniculi TaxID=948313 RepID=A0AAF0ETW5_9BASI|nr:RNA-binding ribosome biosynthesis protein mak21 [Malassezia cuniculi]